MNKVKTQNLNISPITCVGRKIDKLEFDGGKPLEGQINRSDGAFNVTNKIVNSVADKDEKRCQLNMNLELIPEVEEHYYAIKLTVSGLYTSPLNISDDEFTEAALTFGSSDLYSYARSIADTITAGGLWGALHLPQINFTVS